MNKVFITVSGEAANHIEQLKQYFETRGYVERRDFIPVSGNWFPDYCLYNESLDTMIAIDRPWDLKFAEWDKNIREWRAGLGKDQVDVYTDDINNLIKGVRIILPE